jgi:hypothetical protein
MGEKEGTYCTCEAMGPEPSSQRLFRIECEISSTIVFILGNLIDVYLANRIKEEVGQVRGQDTQQVQLGELLTQASIENQATLTLRPRI